MHASPESKPPRLSQVPIDMGRIVRLMRSASRTPDGRDSPRREAAQLAAGDGAGMGGVEFDRVTGDFLCWAGHAMETVDDYSGRYAHGFWCDRCAAVVLPPRGGGADDAEPLSGDAVASSGGSATAVAGSEGAAEPWATCAACGVDVCARCLAEARSDPRCHRRCGRCSDCDAFVALGTAGGHRCPKRLRLEYFNGGGAADGSRSVSPPQPPLPLPPAALAGVSPSLPWVVLIDDLPVAATTAAVSLWLRRAGAAPLLSDGNPQHQKLRAPRVAFAAPPPRAASVVRGRAHACAATQADAERLVQALERSVIDVAAVDTSAGGVLEGHPMRGKTVGPVAVYKPRFTVVHALPPAV